VPKGLGLLSIHHTCLTVKDLARTLQFYGEVLGLELRHLYRYEFEAPEYGPGVSVVLEVGQMELNGVLLEFQQLVEPKLSFEKEDRPRPGPPHIAFMVKDIRRTRDRLEKAGVEFLGPVRVFTTGRTYCQFRDPDGFVIELVEDMPVNQQLREMAERIRATRLARGLTLRQVAAESGMSAANLSQVERGQIMPSITSLLNVARALGVDPDHFFRVTGDPGSLGPLGGRGEPIKVWPAAETMPG